MDRSNFEPCIVNISDLTLWNDNPRLQEHQEDEQACLEKLMAEKAN